MAELLDKLLENAEKFDKIDRILSNVTPPPGIDEHTWLYKEELPLHLINYLREQTTKILSENLCKQTPSKVKSTTKYNYNSPVKSVRKEQPAKKERKDKKKIKLFPANGGNDFGGGGGGNGPRSSNIDPGAETDGVGPIEKYGRYQQKTPPTNGNSSAVFTPKENSFNNRSTGEKSSRKKTSPSPQPFSLGDFISVACKTGNVSTTRSPKKNKNGRHVSVNKCSTPVNLDSFMTRLDRVEENVNRSVIQKISLDIDNKELFPEIGQNTDNEKKRRIKPISLAGSPSNNTGFGQVTSRSHSTSSSNLQFRVAEINREDCLDDRQQLFREAAATSNKTNMTPYKSTSVLNGHATPVKPGTTMTPNNKNNSFTPMLSRSMSTVSMIQPSLEAVTHQQKLDLLVSLYSYVIMNNLMPNYIVEIYFLLELLQVEISKTNETVDIQTDEEDLFHSVHNCVYFSVQVLEIVHPTLQYFDRSTLKLLTENSRVQQFSDKLCSNLEDLMTGFTDESPHKPREHVVKNVSFQADTDNRSNFPSTSSFQDFKKQRDKFYALIRSWQEQYRGKEYDFSLVFGAQVDDIMKMYPHPVNYSHFCSLFLHQMLAMCRGEDLGPLQGQARAGHAQDDLSLLKTLDPVKYAKLAVRLVTPSQLGGPCPLPTFLGAQEFFRDFVLCCNSFRFLAHLKNTLVAEILKQEAAVSNNQGEDTSMLSNCKSDCGDSFTQIQDKSGLGLDDTIHETILSLRLLGKFLGFIEFMPFIFSDHESKGSLSVADSVIETRKACVTPIDLREILHTAESNGKLIVSLPWILEYLAQMDPFGYTLQYYKDIAFRIVQIYQNILKPDQGLSPSVAFFLSIYSGWLLEKDDFPRDLIVLARFQSYTYTNQEQFSIDRTMFVSQSLFNQCCPWLNEIKVLLSTPSHRLNSSLNNMNKEAYKKITPISAPQKNNTVDQTRLLQASLEENFLNNQPQALRRTIEFISERLSSNIIKIVRNNYVPEKLASTYKIIQSSFMQISQKEIMDYCKDSVETVLNQLDETIQTKCEIDTVSTLQILLSDDIHPATQEICVGIVVRNVRGKLDQWCKQNLTNEYFQTVYQGELDRCHKAAEKTKPKQLDPKELLVEHDPSAPVPSSVIIQMKSDLLVLLSSGATNGQPVVPGILVNGQNTSSGGQDDIQPPEETMEKIITCIQKRSDLTSVGINGLGSLSVDWIIALISQKPELVTKKLIHSVLRVWKLLLPVQVLTLLSPTSLLVLAMSKDKQKSWRLMSKLLFATYEEKLLPSLALEDACSDLLTQEIESLDRLLSCLDYLYLKDKSGDLAWIQDWRLEYLALRNCLLFNLKI